MIHLVFNSKAKASTQQMASSNKRKHLATRQWRKQRELVFRTKGHDCYLCGEWANAIDHVTPAKLGGTDDLDNLEPICSRCNSRKGAKPFFLGTTPTPPAFRNNIPPMQSSVVHHSPFNTDSSQS